MDEQGRLRDLKPEWEGLSLEEGHEAALAQLRAEGADRRRGAAAPLGRLRPALRRAGRADRLAAVVLQDGRARRDRHRRRPQRPHHVPPEAAREDLLRLDGVDPALVHLAPAVVGPPPAGLVRARRLLRRAGRAARGRRLGAVHRRARHVVLVGAVAVRDARLARRHAVAAPLVPRQRPRHRARHHQPLGGADDLHRHRVRRRHPVHRRVHPLHDPGRRRPPDVEVARHRRRPARPDRPVRRRRDPLRPAEDVLDAGRALRRGHDRRGALVHEQAVERLPAGAAGRRSRGGRGARPAPSRSTAGS